MDVEIRDAVPDAAYIRVTDVGALCIYGLLQLFDVYGIPLDVGLYICDPKDPDKRFIIKRVEE